jgi:glucan phosphoethanolaminetransferase (alkaline phosphatase superfamily)
MNHILLSIIAFLVTIISENLFFAINKSQSLVPFNNYIGLYIACLLFTFVKGPKLRFFFLALIPTLSIFQMLHISFYGVPVYPSAIYLMFTEVGEMFGTLKEEISLFFIPLLLSIPLIGFLFFMNKKLKPAKSIPFLPVLLFFYLVYNPIRTGLTGNSWGRQPSTQEFMGMNIYLSLSYFSGKILPYKVLRKKDDTTYSSKFTFTDIPKFEGNIIFVIGESLSANHLSLLGYKRPTTPFLDTLKNDPNFYYSKGISSGVSTDVAVAFIANNTYGLEGQNAVIQGKQCLFKLAKKSEFRTTFYSTQSQQQLRYITNSLCLSSVDNYKNLEVLQPGILDSNAADDLKLLENLKEDLFKNVDQSNFYVLHQRGSHGPYNLRYPKDQATFKMVGDYQKDRVNHYDNSVIEFDKFMKSLIETVKSQDKPTIIIYMSDHGEGLGEEGVWGHAALKKPSFSIPVLTYFHNTSPKQDFSREPTHLELTLYISQLLGFKSDLSFPLSNYSILGNDMDGFAGYLDLNFENGTLKDYIRKDI